MEQIVKEMIEKIQAGGTPDMCTMLKNQVNAALAEKINIGDHVRVIKTGRTGVVTKKIEYARDSKDWYSPYGYTAIQVETDGKKYNYAARSLQILKAGIV